MRFSEEEKEIVRKLLKFDYENKMGGKFLEEVANSYEWKDTESNYAYFFWGNKNPEESVAYIKGAYHPILHKKLSLVLFLNELAKKRLILLIEKEEGYGYAFIWGPCKFIEKNNPQNGQLHFVPEEKELKIENANGYIDLETNEWLCQTETGLQKHDKEKYREDVVPIKKIINSRIFISEQLKTLAKNDFETVADRSLKVSKRSFWISIAALLITAIAAFATCFQTSLAREEANSAVDISGKNAVALDDLKNFEEKTEGYLKRNDSIMSSILNILNKQPKNSGKQTSNSGKQTSNSGKQTSNSGKQPKNSGKQTSNSDKQTSKKPNEKGLHK